MLYLQSELQGKGGFEGIQNLWNRLAWYLLMLPPLLWKQWCWQQAVNAKSPCTVLCWSGVGERGCRQQCRKKSLKTRCKTPLLVRLLQGDVCVRVSWLVSQWQPQQKGPVARVRVLCLCAVRVCYRCHGTEQASRCFLLLCLQTSGSSCASAIGRISGSLRSRSV